MKELILTKDNFDQEVINADKPVLVDFWAPWCGPCRMMGPIISGIADDTYGKYVIGKVNIDAENELAEEYNVMSIPTLKFFNNGRVVMNSVGVTSKEDILRMLDRIQSCRDPA